MSPVSKTEGALAQNGRSVQIPAPVQLCGIVWTKAGHFSIGGAVLFLAVFAIWGPAPATIVAVVFVILFYLLVTFTVRAVWALSLAERALLAGGNMLTVAFLARAAGFRAWVTGGQQKKLDYGIEIGEGDIRYVWYAFGVFLVTYVLVAMIQFAKARS